MIIFDEPIAVRSDADKGDLNSLPFLIKLCLLTAAILAGKTVVELRAAVRQAFNTLRANGE